MMVDVFVHLIGHLMMPDRASSHLGFGAFRPLRCAGVCGRLPSFVPPKEQEKGSV
jgi:hypothetical protein